MSMTSHERTERLSTGHYYHYYDYHPLRSSLNETLLCVHGFPDTSYGWRKQVEPWRKAGYRVIIPDMLGYGSSEKPSDVTEYTTKRLSDDLASLLDLLEIQKVVLVGHDWGSYLAGRFALWYPERLRGLVLLSVPFTPPVATYYPLTTIAKQAPNLAYQLYFASSESTKEIEANLDTFLKIIWQAGEDGYNFTRFEGFRDAFKGNVHVRDGPLLLEDAEDMEYYELVFRNSMNGPLNYYRTTELRYEEEKVLLSTFRTLPQGLPVLFIGGTADSTLRPSSIKGMARYVPQLDTVLLEGKGHWLMLEAADAVANKIDEFVRHKVLQRGGGKL